MLPPSDWEGRRAWGLHSSHTVLARSGASRDGSEQATKGHNAKSQAETIRREDISGGRNGKRGGR